MVMATKVEKNWDELRNMIRLRDKTQSQSRHHKNDGLHALNDVHERTTSLDKERFEVARLRQDIIDEYENKSRELLEYLNSMEAAFEQQQHEYEQREVILRNENRIFKQHELRLKSKAEQVLMSAQTQSQKNHKSSWEIENIFDILKEESIQHEQNYKNEKLRVQELRRFIRNLQMEIDWNEETMLRQRKRLDQTKKQMEGEIEELRRKAALGWMLGCLFELYMRLEPEVGTTGIMKLVRKVQKELELGSGDRMFCNHSQKMPSKLEYETIQQEIMRLINHAQDHIQTNPLHTEPEACAIQVKETDEQKNGHPKKDSHICAEPWCRHQTGRCYNTYCCSHCGRKDNRELMRPRTTPSTSGCGTCHSPHGAYNGTDCDFSEQLYLKADNKSKPILRRRPPVDEALEFKSTDDNKSGRRTWAEIRLMDKDEANRAEAYASTLEVKSLLISLQNSCNFLMSHEQKQK